MNMTPTDCMVAALALANVDVSGFNIALKNHGIDENYNVERLRDDLIRAAQARPA